MKPLFVLTLLVALAGCDQSSLSKAAQSVAEKYDVQQPELWALPDGQKIDIGGEVTYIIGTDQCTTGFGSTYACWKFSLKPGDTQLVSLANGTQELWTTEDAGRSRVSLVRPNGFKVVGK
jgi:hypothetical protein